MLTHVVLLRLHDPAVADELAALLRDLDGRIPGLVSVRAGRNEVPSDRAFDLGLVAELEDEAALATYQQHPAHLAVAGELRAAAAQIVTVDFTS